MVDNFTDSGSKKSEKELASEAEALREENSSLKRVRESYRQTIEQLKAEQYYLTEVTDGMRNAAFIVNAYDRIKYLNREAKKFLKGGRQRVYR